MIHTKFFTRRLALAAGLMLGWTSGAVADIRLSVSSVSLSSWSGFLLIREEAGRTEITVTARNYASSSSSASLANVATDTHVSLQTSTIGLNSRFRITLPTLVIPEGESQTSGTITFTPIDDNLMGDDNIDDGGNDDLRITISGNAGATAVQSTAFYMLDNDKSSTEVFLSLSQNTLSKRAGPAEIVVTAELSGEVMTSDVSFQLRIDARSTVTRDVDYFAQLGSITIRRRRGSGTATITITPNNKGTGQIELTGSVAGLNVLSSQIHITDANLSIQSLTATPTSIRENAGRTEITLTVTLAEAPVVDEIVSFDIVAPSAGTPAVRDADYRATLPPGRAVTIAAGQIQGSATLIFTPDNNQVEDGDKSLGVRATASGGSKQVDITIADDETSSESIELSVNPAGIREDAGATAVTITATLKGKVLDQDVSLIFVEDSAGTATRDSDYTRPAARLTIPAGQIQGSGTVTITPIDDGEKEANETIILRVTSNPQDEYGDPIAVGTATITLRDTGERVEPPPAGDTTPVFAGAAANVSATVGTAITPVVLPAATGDGTLTYSVSTLPAGLAFNAATRTLSGTPTAAGTQTITYTVIDGDEVARESAAMTFTITVAPKPQRTVAVQSLTSSHSSIREDAGPTEITLTVTLAEAAPANETVRFALVIPRSGTLAVRDTDYKADLPSGGSIVIAAGKKEGTLTLILTPIDDAVSNGLRSFGVQAIASGGSAQTDITITDDETASTSITLSVNPHTISEQDDRTRIEVTATLKGGELAENITVIVEIDAASTATRDLDYSALFNQQIVIQAGSITGSTLFVIQPMVDTLAEGDETIRLIGKINGVVEDEAEITLSDPAAVPSDSPASSIVVAGGNYTYTVGTKITLLMPEQTRLVSGQPAGLEFDEDTRMLSGTPTEATGGAVTVSYVVTDQDGKFDLKEFTITINPSSSDPSDSPSSSIVVAGGNYTYTVGTKITLLMPEQTRLVSGQPAGLEFDEDTRMLSGTPTEATGGAVTVSYVVDQDGDFDFKEFTITINPSSSDPSDSPGSSLGFATAIADQEYTAGTAISPLVLPAATGGTPPLTYGVSGLPAGLRFDKATRTIAGTPTEATDGVVTVIYTVIDQDGNTFSETFSITVNSGIEFGDLFDVFGAGKIVPTASHDLTAIREFVVGQRVEDVVLPAAAGGTPPLMYSLSPTLPAGLAFDPATRTIAGTPLAAGETAYTYTVTDANGASASLSLQTRPTAFSLADNFPNPFNPATTIQYALPQATDVELAVYNVVGQPVRTLVAEHQSAGRYAVEWDATDDSGYRLSSGMYFYRLQAGGELREVKKMLLLK